MALNFELNGQMRSENDVSTSMTVLDYLRLKARLTGTKEGCAEGDCGACTIVIAPLGEDKLHYRAVNACLMVVPQLDGHSVLTVEGLAGRDGTLHSVQQSLVETDATQCGFCTPGFVMAMFAFAQSDEERSDEAIHEALAGNLCRCTGYRPIVEACRIMRADPPGCASAQSQVPIPIEEYRRGSQLYLTPRTLDQMAEVKASHPDAIVLAGGTDLGLRVSKDRISFPAVISTRGVAALQEIKDDDGVLTIGGGVTYTQALPYLDRHFPSFATLVRRIGSRQIRNLGTFAGNLANASPIGDTIPCLMALGAEIALRSKKRVRIVSADDFILGYRKTALAEDEFIESILIPLLPAGTSFIAYKLSKRFDQDISTVVAAFRLRVDGGNVSELRAAYGGMAAQAGRAKNVETAVTGKPWTADTLRNIDAVLAKDFQPMTDHRGTNAYRLRSAANLIRRLQVETTTEPAALQVWDL
ncbi:xanthine dehydrogenase small subunit [Pseudorhodoplanes sinuspersici]|uniref:Xanthine dehydrogenase small subunit n=1 Tax=Pseudorhodoplanes sinuspersici TaxID=1235591 RepID=A0A1W6ZPT7_9HYPH|nr:xanthine dehydrogenase small subunit [Pseudorhodoplanes sinuspersici]ARP99379.1 xanthine dehydrogenase small subunit [Pseudorhodoplanes sinuspersici]RKE70316.1 xanthine dehydrogenase small subunit [Pseudorhodoplanes sinuspersici]